MKRLVLLAALLMFASSAAYAGMPDCYFYPNNAPFDLGTNGNGCYSYEYSNCYQCVNVDNGTGCASTRICNPDGNGVMPPRTLLATAVPWRSEPTRISRPSHRVDSLRSAPRVAKLDVGKLF